MVGPKERFPDENKFPVRTMCRKKQIFDLGKTNYEDFCS